MDSEALRKFGREAISDCNGSGVPLTPASCRFKLVNRLERWSAIFSSGVRPLQRENIVGGLRTIDRRARTDGARRVKSRLRRVKSRSARVTLSRSRNALVTQRALLPVTSVTPRRVELAVIDGGKP